MQRSFTALLAATLAVASSYASVAASDDPLAAAINAGEFKEITSVVWATDGQIRYEQYFGDGSAELLNDTRSATKTLVAMAIGAAIADGDLAGTDVSVWSLFESDAPFRFDSPTKRAITVRDLLTMSSALDCNDNEWETPGNEEHMYPARRWTFFVLDLPVEEGYTRDERGYGPFRYCTAGSFMLGQVVERATGEPVDQYVKRRLFAPLGIDTVSWPTSPSGEIQTGGGTRLSSRSLLTIGELLRNDGVHAGETVLPGTWISEMTTDHIVANDRQRYGYQIWHEDFACGDGTVSGWYLSGNGGNKVVIVDELDATIVVTATLYGTRGMHQQSTDIVEQHVLPTLSACQGTS
ncbi:MAG: serine hydrolase [Pseudomonadota bacterium]